MTRKNNVLINVNICLIYKRIAELFSIPIIDTIFINLRTHL